MSFTAHRAYNLVPGRNYDPATNGNVAVKFRGSYDSSVPNTITLVSYTGDIDPIAQLNNIHVGGGVPVIIGPGFIGRIGVLGEPPLPGPNWPITGQDILCVADPATAIPGFPNGTYDYYIFDQNIPSSIDGPILAFHVIEQSNPPVPGPDDIDIRTLTGDLAAFPGGALVTGGIYAYSVASVPSLAGAAKLLGLATAGRSNQW